MKFYYSEEFGVKFEKLIKRSFVIEGFENEELEATVGEEDKKRIPKEKNVKGKKKDKKIKISKRGSSIILIS